MNLLKLKQLRDDIKNGSSNLTDNENNGYLEELNCLLSELQSIQDLLLAGGDERSLHRELWNKIEGLFFTQKR